MNVQEILKAAGAVAPLVVDALQAVKELIDRHAGVSGKDAADILTAVRAIVSELDRVEAGQVTPERARDEINRVRAALAQNDARADAIIRRRKEEEGD